MREHLDKELATRVLNMRRAGATFEAISERLELPAEKARALYQSELKDLDPELAMALELDRLDRLHMAVWQKATQGDLDAIDRVLKISERRDRVRGDATPNLHELRAAYDKSVETSTQVLDVDSALLAAGRKIADRVDEAVSSGDGMEVTKALYLLPHMVNVLREMLATPASRNAANITPAVAEGKLAKLRAIQGTKQA